MESNGQAELLEILLALNLDPDHQYSKDEIVKPLARSISQEQQEKPIDEVRVKLLRKYLVTVKTHFATNDILGPINQGNTRG